MADMLAGSVLITGCNRGLGLEMIRQLVTSSTPPRVVIGTCRKPDEALQTTYCKETAPDETSLNLKRLAKVQQIGSQNQIYTEFLALESNVVDYKSLPGLVEEVGAAVGPQGLNLLINNAGIMDKCSSQMFGIPLEHLEPHTFSNVMETNTTAPLMLVKEMLPLLRKAATVGGAIGVRRAAVVNISSIMGSMVVSRIVRKACDVSCTVRKVCDVNCTVSKAALNMLTKILAMNFGDEGLMFVAIHPGWVQTDMGTSSGMITTQESISRIFKTLPTLMEKHNGLLVSYDGTVMPW
ncbi:Enoyl-[acyl-carrier-protein] reductase-like 2 [Homarus americanus]|uniref:Enoyl-[acyl-carrier-protein] reductase-like 2 n=1 Tax=Homarus americanus TaxID=6706 RepID=A0A8J5JLX3_HOMAM|nr:Enoyl-[acyl-carrier-protein] reductase-like 2 [Homarus americanus]